MTNCQYSNLGQDVTHANPGQRVVDHVHVGYTPCSLISQPQANKQQ